MGADHGECRFCIFIRFRYSYLLYEYESWMIKLSFMIDKHSNACIYRICIIA